MVLRKSFYIRWSAGRSPRVHEVNPCRDPSDVVSEPRFSKWYKDLKSLFSYDCFNVLF